MSCSFSTESRSARRFFRSVIRSNSFRLIWGQVLSTALSIGSSWQSGRVVRGSTDGSSSGRIMGKCSVGGVQSGGEATYHIIVIISHEDWRGRTWGQRCTLGLGHTRLTLGYAGRQLVLWCLGGGCSLVNGVPGHVRLRSNEGVRAVRNMNVRTWEVKNVYMAPKNSQVTYRA